MEMRFYMLVYIILTASTIDVSCECGIVPNQENFLNASEDMRQFDHFPWDVQIFKLDNRGTSRQACVGTLISPSVVISSASCFYDDFSDAKNDARTLTVVAGKSIKGYYKRKTEMYQTEVESIHLARGFQGFSEFWSKNIAWLSLKRSFNLTPTISPVCVDFDNQYESEDLQSGQVGKIISTVRSSDIPGRRIRLVTLSVISNDECVSMISEYHRQFVTADKICARSSSGFHLDPHSSGGGLHFQHNGRWYLRGVLSPDFLQALNEGYPVTLVNVGRFLNEIKDNIKIKQYECGTVTLPVNTLIVGGHGAEHGGHPWHIAVYQKNSTEFYSHICGGSLISSNVVVSAAHCFYDDNRKKVKDASHYAVAAGKHYRPYNWPEPFVQKSPVQTIHLPSRYYGIDGNYAADIAWLILQRPFDLSSYVKPICLESSRQHDSEHLQIGLVGRVAGWGITAVGLPSHDLQEISAPFVQHEECISTLPQYSRPWITTDKFCAGHLNGSKLCNGDSGGGLAVQRTGRWYLLGIVSINPIIETTCNTPTYTAFTDVKRYYDELYRFTNLTTNELL